MTIWQLMKNLRAKWWIPRWYNEVIHTVYDKKHKIIWLYKEWKEYLELVYKKSLRELCSKESWLWQYVCENHLYIYKMWENKNFIQDHFKNEYNECCYQYWWDKSCYEYYLLESALCDEDKLEEFLLNSIKLD
jgi:hypothetical protein